MKGVTLHPDPFASPSPCRSNIIQDFPICALSMSQAVDWALLQSHFHKFMLKLVFCWHLWWWFLKWLKPLSWNKDKEWGLQSVHNAAFLLLLPPHTLPLLQHSIPPLWDSSPWTSPVWVLPTFFSFSRSGPCTEYCPSGMSCPSLGPYRKPTPLRPVCELLLSSGHIHLLWHGIFHQAACRWISAPS